MPVVINHHNEDILVPRVIIIRGAPGVGKTTISKKVCSLLKSDKLVYLPIDNIQHLDLRKTTQDKLKLGIYNSAILTRNFIHEGFDVVVDYIFDKDILFFIEKIFHSSTVQLAHCVVQPFFLDVTFEKTKERNAGRPDPMPIKLLEKLYKSCSQEKGHLLGENIIDTNSKNINAKTIALKIISENNALKDIGEQCDIKVQ